MTDKELLSAYLVRPLGQSKTTLIAYGLPIGGNLVRLYNAVDKPLRVLSVNDLYTWAVSCDVCVEPPILSDNVRYTDEDIMAYNRLVEFDKMEDARRQADISKCLDRLRTMLH